MVVCGLLWVIPAPRRRLCPQLSLSPQVDRPSLQLRAADAEMLTPAFGELQVRAAHQNLDGAQHNAAKED